MQTSLIVIGGSGDIGRAICLKANSLVGVGVCIHYFKNERAAQDIVTQLLASNINAIAKYADLRDPSSIRDLFVECEAKLGPLQYLVNSAAIQGTISPFIDVKYEEIVDVIHTNFIGFFITCQEAAKRMMLNKEYYCSIVNISSQASLHGSPNEWIHYASSKASIDTLTKGLAIELGRHNIRVNAVRPGLINTKIHQLGNAPNRLVNKVKDVALGRIGTPEEVAELVLFLLNEKASYINGALIDINGGR